eukprot:scaffold9668_cov101-Isochrysis_galbana.AAC.3
MDAATWWRASPVTSTVAVTRWTGRGSTTSPSSRLSRTQTHTDMSMFLSTGSKLRASCRPVHRACCPSPLCTWCPQRRRPRLNSERLKFKLENRRTVQS